MAAFVIETNNLTKTFKGFKPVDALSLQVKKGEVYGFLGPNGAGKTTTIRMLLGLIRPTKGEVRIFGKPLERYRLEIARKIGSMVETPSYYGHLTGYENLEITRKLLDAERKDIDRVLEIVRLTEWRNTKVKTYSLGMKQRLGIAQALIGKPELLILDEPTNGLDPAGIHEIRDLIVTLPEQMNMTVLVSSHILQEVERIADRVGIINHGKLLFQGELAELQSRSQAKIYVEADRPDEAARLLFNTGYRIEKREGALYIDADKSRAAEINKSLILNGYDVSHISEERKSLEDIFLEMTKEAQSV
ncbi:ABC transporter ATP-binding protein [Aneurinibacillus aneurinilyticus]|jgi:ABC-2 type transport system ATP-binding protein|uniref:ABC transporter ATP-binding protein n=2 Tax=Aneurinibacillus aneurinilyticus TaxID=1391 RepID=A0A848CZ42_ANEAE|nr:ABC transporter ATP-binding protein [Aneurinibacillus aneurinilyticus]ERI09692.1 putative bacitracin ABC transporter, ATP-binding protein BcrA [Aneurinibacillus aneurinilyticus ATCC 12856]MCI1696365.1 ABC transporter ATP-binding protein [Aneurinibacillus aneurinilyticus]MED0672610.1 ABC transporter ATP-binding protein [Aneurinibacillus aneurinilyticus]MED0708414.1 ABC transporter ATP-binding protein [Aneurinibacillus aneurinilyticus]MED0722519.1 ABC transporter ATP-binding protein [Aneurini